MCNCCVFLRSAGARDPPREQRSGAERPWGGARRPGGGFWGFLARPGRLCREEIGDPLVPVRDIFRLRGLGLPRGMRRGLHPDGSQGPRGHSSKVDVTAPGAARRAAFRIENDFVKTNERVSECMLSSRGTTAFLGTLLFPYTDRIWVNGHALGVNGAG